MKQWIDPQKIEKLFPVKQNHLYFNFASDGPLPLPAVEAITNAVREKSENGLTPVPKQIAVYEEIRKQLAILFQSAPENFAFTKNTSEGVLLALLAMDIKEGENYIVASDAFPTTIRMMESNCKGELRFVKINDPEPLNDQLAAKCDDKTRAFVLDWVHFFSGKIIDLEAITELARSRGIFTVIDGIQGAGALELDLGKSNIDFFVTGGHKWMLSPQGTGFIYVSPEVWNKIPRKAFGWLGYNWKDFSDFDIDPELREGAEVMEYGTRSYTDALGFQHCLELINSIGIKTIEHHNRQLRNFFLEKIIDKGYESLQDPKQITASIIPFKPVNEDSLTVIKRLSHEKVVLSLRNGYIRAAFHWVNHRQEVERFLELL